MLHVLRPKHGAVGAQGGRNHQRVVEGEAVALGLDERLGMRVDVEWQDARAQGADRGDSLADLAPSQAKLAVGDIGEFVEAWTPTEQPFASSRSATCPRGSELKA